MLLTKTLLQKPTFRPIITSVSELIKLDKSRIKDRENVKKLQNQLSEVTDMIHTAFTFHGCVSDETLVELNGNPDPRYKAVHRDNILSLLIGDYLLAQASLDLANLRFPKVVGLIAKGIEDYTNGEFLKLQMVGSLETMRASDIEKDIIEYAQLTCGSLLANACLSTALLAGHPNLRNNQLKNNEVSDMVFNFGYHVGSAHKLLDLLIDRHPEHESELDKRFYSKLSQFQFGGIIKSHLEDATNILMLMPRGRNRATLMGSLETMRKRSPI